ncbi:hypothetical protein J7E25_10800 [Agromyces sp. ISL-38]|uniref:hypothetical protein n=1 Tax=Agromyces sp. ISL-38 TaxID=2819107 RepID=UPI001BE63B8E|nr:hypothetical protein [Agromyces sp. ISL-38]MBT2499587.1 hypothetical protein [Agromyces sp. ISL-38]
MTDEVRASIAALNAERVSDSRVAKLIGLSQATVTKVRGDLGLTQSGRAPGVVRRKAQPEAA